MRQNRYIVTTVLLIGSLFVGCGETSPSTNPDASSSFHVLDVTVEDLVPPLPERGVSITSEGSGDVRWILPGVRRLDPAIFGTPADPKGLESDIGVPLSQRLTTPDGSAWTTTAHMTPFSDNWAPISGHYQLSAYDGTRFDDPASRDWAFFHATFSGPDGRNYAIDVREVLPVGTHHPFLGGVGTNFSMHGRTGLGTRLMPTSLTMVAFWGVGTFSVDGVIAAQDRLVHAMMTCDVRDADYRIVFDGQVNCRNRHMHLMVPQTVITNNGPTSAPLPTGFRLPNGTEQPFLHIMFEDVTLDTQL